MKALNQDQKKTQLENTGTKNVHMTYCKHLKNTKGSSMKNVADSRNKNLKNTIRA